MTGVSGPIGRRSLLREYLEALLVAVLFALGVRTFVVQAFKIPSGSMEENLLVGDHILVNKFVYGTGASPLEHWVLPTRQPKRGDVLVFRFPDDPHRDFIKRCVALPGDTIDIRDKELFVNGEPVDESGYVTHTDSRTYPASPFLDDNYRFRDNYGPYTVPEDHFFVLGDNRDNSHDSRFWGPVPGWAIKGRALLVYWSFDPGTDPHDGSWGDRLAAVGREVFSRTRWDRSLRVVR